MMRRSGWWRGVAGAFAFLLALAGAPVAPAQAQAVTTADDVPVGDVPATDVEDDPQVREAARRLALAQERLADVEAALDAAAAGYERATAHHLRLQAELEQTRGEVARVQREQAARRERHREQVREAYKHPERSLALGAAVLRSADAGDALHRAALLQRSTVVGAARLDRAQRSADLQVEAERQMRVIAAGARSSAQERQEASGRLQRLLVELGTERAAADRALAAAREAAERRVASGLAAWDAVNRERTFASLLATARGAPPPPVVDGRVCPIGAPNGFSDTWGAPRSGGRRHKGVDVFAAYGTPLYAVDDGTIVAAGYQGLGGLRLQLVDDRGDRFYYAHLSSLAVREGDRVQRGQVVGTVGDSGNARTTPPHLHWQFHPGGGEAVNPYPLTAALCRAPGAVVRTDPPLVERPEQPAPEQPTQAESSAPAAPAPGRAEAGETEAGAPQAEEFGAGEPETDDDPGGPAESPSPSPSRSATSPETDTSRPPASASPTPGDDAREDA